MIKKFKSLIEKVVGIATTKVECAIDEDVVDCKEIGNMPPWGDRPVDEHYEFVVDDWFATPYKDEKLDVVTGEPTPPVIDPITGEEYTYEPPSSEPENIHQLMYDIATNNGKHLQGGSETFQENVNLDNKTWQSGTGWTQFK